MAPLGWVVDTFCLNSAGVSFPRLECGRISLYPRRNSAIRIFASIRFLNHCALGHRAPSAATHIPKWISPPTAARTLAGSTSRVYLHTPPAAASRTRSPFFCGNFLHHLDLEVPLRHQLLQLPVFLLQMTQALHVHQLELGLTRSRGRVSTFRLCRFAVRLSPFEGNG